MMDKKSRDLVMGKLFLKNKDYKMAEKSFSEYLSTNPEDYQALKMLAQVQEHLNDTAKAFDLYQRCYLAQPDRKGVLLDICRLLLIKDSRLDHVDQKKWLKLAAHSFPTNPIVTNLRDTLPNSQDSHPGRITTEDLILEKLTSLEDRFRNFEDRLKGIEDKLTDLLLKPINPLQNASTQEPTTVSTNNLATQTYSPAFKTITPEAPVLSAIAKPATPVFKPVAPETFPKSVSPIFNPVTSNAPAKPTDNPIFPTSSLFSTLNLSKNSTTDATPQLNCNLNPMNSGANVKPLANDLFSKLNLNSTASDSPTKPAVPAEQPKLNIGQMAFGSPQKLESNQPTQAAGPFNFTGVNLFAESLKKMSMPTEGVWTPPKTTSSPKTEKEDGKGDDYDADDNDSEVVNNEELPIESFCDMKPIEIKSGEEDEDIVFENRCKLFRFRDKEYKERGLGNIKVLRHKETGKGRIIMRREQINLVCLNCWSCTKIERVRDTQVRFAGLDASDGDPVSTIFLAKFGTQEKTDEFLKHLTDLFAEE